VWVVKLGGSLIHSPALHGWLHAIADHGRGRIVVAPGGGPFADTVRAEQQRLRFPDPIAHRMALRAMDQYGLLLCGLKPGLIPEHRVEHLSALLRDERVAVWLPSAALDHAQDIPAKWDVTSDTLAAWLARALGATHLLWVKACPLAKPTATAAELVAQRILDPAFPAYCDPRRIVARCVAASDYPRLTELMQDDQVPIGTRLVSVAASG
jgi:aspartokinase-like uncharacterized kinase